MRRLVFLLCLGLVSALLAEDAALSRRLTTDVTPLVEDPTDTNIVMLTTEILRRSHFSRREFDDKVSSEFLDRYLDSLDNLHLYFIESDLQEFEKYRHQLDDLSIKLGDSTPARHIFTRFRQRLLEQYNYATNLLYTEKFTFTGNDRFTLDRKNLPRPKDLAEAHKLWRDRLRYEYLQEKLALPSPEPIVELIASRLREARTSDLAAALEEKLSKDKAAEIARLVADRLPAQKPDAIVAAVRERLEEFNAEEIRKTIVRRYTRVVRMINEYDNDDVLQYYLTALCRVFDPHSDYMGKSDLENFSIGMKLSLFGIGALLRSEDGICKIQSLTPGGPAERSGKLKANDQIIAVAQGTNEFVDVVDMKLNKVVELIRGPKDSEVRLRIIPADAPSPSVRKVVSLVRDEIKLEDGAAKAQLIEMPVEGGRTIRLGVIDLPSFYSTFELEGRRGQSQQRSTTIDVARLIRKLVRERAAGIVLDLRRNGGGSLSEAISLTGLFIKEGPVVQISEHDGRVSEESDQDPTVFYDGPLVVLTGRFSASASEILAGALQDYGRAVIVGDASTHGKGTVQSLLEYGPMLRARGIETTHNPGGVKITIRKFYRASGSSTQLEGVIPDIILPSINNHAEIGEKFLDNALPHDTIRQAGYEKLNRVEPYLAELKRRSEARIAADKDFAYEREEIERYKKDIADKSVSLNEAERRREKKENEERARARRKELAARPAPPWTIYEITLKDADKPGLPAPLSRTNLLAAAKSTNAVPVTGQVQAGTNAPAIPVADLKPPGHPAGGDDDEVPADAVQAPDIRMHETWRILIDYIGLLSKAYTLSGGAAARLPQ